MNAQNWSNYSSLKHASWITYMYEIAADVHTSEEEFCVHMVLLVVVKYSHCQECVVVAVCSVTK